MIAAESTLNGAHAGFVGVGSPNPLGASNRIRHTSDTNDDRT